MTPTSTEPTTGAPSTESRADRLCNHLLAYALLRAVRTSAVSLSELMVYTGDPTRDTATLWRDEASLREGFEGLQKSLVGELSAMGFAIKAPRMAQVEDMFENLRTIPARPAFDL